MQPLAILDQCDHVVIIVREACECLCRRKRYILSEGIWPEGGIGSSRTSICRETRQRVDKFSQRRTIGKVSLCVINVWSMKEERHIEGMSTFSGEDHPYKVKISAYSYCLLIFGLLKVHGLIYQ